MRRKRDDVVRSSNKKNKLLSDPFDLGRRLWPARIRFVAVRTYPELNFSKESVDLLCDFLSEILVQLFNSCKSLKRDGLFDSSTIHAGMNYVFSGDLLKHAVAEGVQGRKKFQEGGKFDHLIFKPSEVEKFGEGICSSLSMTGDSLVFVSTICEYFAAELTEVRVPRMKCLRFELFFSALGFRSRCEAARYG